MPVIGGQEQAHGRERAGEVLSFVPDAAPKQVIAEVGGAYPVPELQGLERTIRLETEGEAAGTVTLVDAFRFEEPQGVQEAFVTWLEVEAEGNVALVHGERRDLRLTIEAPEGAVFAVTSLEEACEENAKEEVLKRISVDLAPSSQFAFRIRMEWLEGQGGSA